MTKQVQRRRGTSTQHTSFTGAEGEISVNTTNKSIHVHDGSTAGGVEAARADLTNVSDANLNAALSGNTLSSLTITSVDINGGTIDGAVIGGSSAAAGTFTTVTASGDLTIADKIVHSGDTNTAIRFPAADTVTVETSGAERLRVTSAGDVLQGTTSAITGAGSVVSVNQVAGTTAASGRAAFVYSATNTAAPVYEMGKSANATVGSHTLVDDGETLGTLRWSGSDGTNFIRAAEIVGIVNGTPGTSDMPGALTFGTTADGGTAPTERMRITSAGNVGIGSTAPSAKLMSQVSTFTDADKVALKAYNAQSVGAFASFQNSATGTAFTDGFRIGIDDSENAVLQNLEATNMLFATSATERMRIDSSGNVGIGTSSPADVLDVAAAADGGIRLTDSTNEARFCQITQSAARLTLSADPTNAVSTSYINFLVDANERMRIDSSGNVGIGTTTPDFQLHVDNTAGNATIGIIAEDASNSILYMGDQTSNTVAYISYNHASNFMNFRTNSVDRMRIDSAGNVGIGTTSPAAQLHVAGNTTNIVTLSSSSISGTTMTVGTASSNAIAVGNIVYGVGVAPITKIVSQDSGTAGGAGTYTVSVSQTVASGTMYTGPGAVATIRVANTDTSVVAGQPEGTIEFFGTDANTPGAGVGAYISAISESTSPDSALTFGTRDNAGGGVDANERMRITSAGNVGIGTNSPGGLGLTVAATPAVHLVLRALDNTSESRIWFGDPNSDIMGRIEYEHNNDAMAFWTASTERMRIDSSGNVLVGTTSINPHTGTSEGVQISNDRVHVSRSGGPATELNRVNNDGDIAVFRKDGTTVGSIGSLNGVPGAYFGTGSTAISAYSGALRSVDGSTGSYVDNTIDIGTASSRFKNLYLSGGVSNPAAGGTLTFGTVGTERMRIDSSGNVGIGVSSPAYNLDIQDTGDAALRVKANSSGAAADDDATLILDATETGEAVLSFRQDGVEKAWLEFFSGGGPDVNLTTTAGTGANIDFQPEEALGLRITSSGAVLMPFVYADTVTGRDLFISSTGQLGYVSSTRASKTNIQDLSDVSWLYSLNPVSFQYRVRNEDDTYSDEIEPQPEYGLIAEDVELVNPDLVFYDETENGRELRGIQYSRLIAPLLKAIQEQQSLITDLTARVSELENRNP